MLATPSLAMLPSGLAGAASSAVAPLLPYGLDANVVVPCILGPLFLLLCEYAQTPNELNKIYVRPGVGAYGVGLLAIQNVPQGGIICTCSADNAVPIRSRRLNLLRPSVRNAVLELYDGWDSKGNYQVRPPHSAAFLANRRCTPFYKASALPHGSACHETWGLH